MKKLLITLISAIFMLWWISQAENYTAEQKDAYDYAYSQKITTISPIEKANMNGELTRIAMAKMISNYAINVLWLQPDTSKDCLFSDVSSSLDSDYNYGATQACQLWLMWIWNDWKKSNKFYPYTTVTRAQFATAFSRALSLANWKVIENWNPYYSTHLAYLQSEWIIKNTSTPSPSNIEKRWNVMIMMQRASNKSKNIEDDNELIWNSEYYYKNLDITANVWLDWKIDMLENFIAYYNVEKHWIIRSIPLENTHISDINVKWENFITYTEDWSIYIRIWDIDKTIKWAHTYPISYKIDWLIKKYSKYSEFYWNLVGYGFDTNINNVRAEIILPKTYTGFTKEDFLITTDWKSKTIDWFEWTVDWSKWDKIIITYDKWLSAYEWITLYIRFPEGYFEFDNSQSDWILDVSWDENQIQKISAGILAKLKDKWVIRWPENAKITIVEFTELLTPYCQKQSQQWTINSVIQQLSGQVNSISRPFIINWDDATKLSLAMECIWELKPWIYYKTLDKAFEIYPIDIDGLIEIAVDFGVNRTSLEACINEWKYNQFITDIMELWSQMGVGWIPSSIIINNETWEYKIIIWAYPTEYFIEAVESLL